MSITKHQINKKKILTFFLELIILLIKVSEIQSDGTCMSSDMKLVEFNNKTLNNYGQARLSPLSIVYTLNSSGDPGALIYKEKLFIDTDFQIYLNVTTTANPTSFDGLVVFLSTNQSSIYRPSAAGGDMGYVGFSDGIVLEIDPYYNSNEATKQKMTHAVFRECMGSTLCSSYIHNSGENIYYFPSNKNYTITKEYNIDVNIVYDHASKNLKLYLFRNLSSPVLTYSADLPSLFNNYAYFGFVGVMKSCNLYPGHSCSYLRQIAVNQGHICLQYINSTFKLKYNGSLYDTVTISAGSSIAANIDYKDYIFANPPVGTLSSEGNKCGFNSTNITYNSDKSVITEGITTCTEIVGTYKINLAYGNFSLDLLFTVIPGPLYALIYITPQGTTLSTSSSTVTLSSNLLIHGKYNSEDTDNESSTILIFRALDRYNNQISDLGYTSDEIKSKFAITIKRDSSTISNCIYSNLGDGTYKLVIQTNNIGKYTLSSNYLINSNSGTKITYSFERAIMNMFENYQELDYYQELEGYLENEVIQVQEQGSYKEREEYQILVENYYDEKCQEEITEYKEFQELKKYQERIEEELIKEVIRERKESYKELEIEECREYYKEKEKEIEKEMEKEIEKEVEKEIEKEIEKEVEKEKENEKEIEKEERKEEEIKHVEEREEKVLKEIREEEHFEELCHYNNSIFEMLSLFNESENLLEYLVDKGSIVTNNFDDIICLSLINERNGNKDTKISIEYNKTYFHFYDNKSESKFIDNNSLSNCKNDLKAAYNLSNDSKLYFAELLINDAFLLSTQDIKFKVFDEKGNELDINICKNKGIILSYDLTNLSINDVNFTEIFVNGEKNINILNASENIFNDHCSSYSKDSFDLTLQDRREYIFKNLSLCSEGCELERINDSHIICLCNDLSAIKEFGDEEVSHKILSYNVFTNTKVERNNLNLFLCYKRFGELNVIVFYVGIFLIASSLLSLIIYLAKEIKYTVIFFKIFNMGSNDNVYEKNFDFANLGANQNKENKELQDIKEYEIKLGQNPVSKGRNKERSISSSSSNQYSYSRKSSYKQSKNNLFDKVVYTQNPHSSYRYFQYSQVEEMKMVNNYKNLSWNLNNLKFADAIVLDKEKSYCKYMSRILKSKIIIISFICDDYTFYLPKSLRLLIVLFNISLYIFLQCIHYDTSYISRLFIRNMLKRENIFLYVIKNDIYRCIIVSLGALIIGRLINILLVPRIMINKLLNSRNKGKRQFNIKKLFYAITIIMTIIVFLFLLVSWYYSSIFSAIYNYTQIYMLLSCFISIIISLLLVLIINLIFGTIKFKGLTNRNS